MRLLIVAAILSLFTTTNAVPQPAVVAFGDSVTVGYGAFSQSAMWVNQLQTPVDNRAVFDTTVAQQLNFQIIPYDGAATTAIWFSCNYDLYNATTADDYAAAVRGGVVRLQERGLRVLLGTCLAPVSYRTMVGNAELHDAYNVKLADVARETGATLVDINAVYDPATMERDGMCAQPNDTGHAVIARAFLAALRLRVALPYVTVPSADQ